MSAGSRLQGEEPTEELTLPQGESYADWILSRQIAIERITRAVESHKRTAESSAIAITPADRLLYERVERLGQSN